MICDSRLWRHDMAIHATPQRSHKMFEGLFSLLSHMLSIRGVTLLDPNMFGELHPELNIRPCSPMVTSVFLGLQNG